MHMQIIHAATEGPTHVPGRGKQAPGEGNDAFAALLWLLQSGQVTPMAGDLIDVSVATAARPGQMAATADALPGTFAGFAHAPPGMNGTLVAGAETESMAAPAAETSVTFADMADAARFRLAAATAQAVAEGAEGAMSLADTAVTTATDVPLRSDDGAADGVAVTRHAFTLPATPQDNAEIDGPHAAQQHAAASKPEPTVSAAATPIARNDEAEATAQRRPESVHAPAPEQPTQAVPAMTIGQAELTGAGAAQAVTTDAAAVAEVPASPWLQVVRQLEQRGPGELRPDGQTLELQLHPAELGTVRLRLTYNAGQLAAELQVATAAVKEALEAGLPQLRETLQAQGFDVHGLSVDVRDGGERNGHARADDWQMWAGRQHGGPGVPGDRDAVPAAAAAAAYRSTGLLDIRA